VDDGDYDQVIQFRWRTRTNRGDARQVYVCRSVYPDGKRGKQILLHLHQFLMPAPEGMTVDHINGDGLDNQRSNLRFATYSQNAANRQLPYARRSSQFKGVTWDKSHSRWMAQIGTPSGHRTLGRFRDEESAARAYDAAALETWGEFAYINFREVT
jgi:hypothetical protein